LKSLLKQYKNPVMTTLRLLLTAAVAWGIWQTVQSAQADFQKHAFNIAEVHWGWLALSSVFSLVGMLPMAFYWHYVLGALGQRPRLGESLRAFYIGNLGKYVPGKAMVVVLRADFIRSSRVDPTVAAVSVFVETLTMMAVGACLSAVILAIFFGDQVQLLILAIGLLVCAGTPTLPPIFRRVVAFLQVSRANADIDCHLEGLNYRVMAVGWALNLVGWFFLGLSLWATLQAMPNLQAPLTMDVSLLARLTATIALALVAGFVSMLPGGLGVREWVLMQMLGGFGPSVAVVSAVLLRLTWLVAEVLFSIILYIVGRRPVDAVDEKVED
jgi:uncharacterized membrane protein YbhN (UPF0104 family)